MARPGLIIDRDGTVIEDCGYVSSTDQMVLLPGVVDALAQARKAGVLVVLATNQAAIGHGIVTEATVTALHEWLGSQVPFDAVYVCPHHPDDRCACRKPMPGLLEQAITDLDLDRAVEQHAFRRAQVAVVLDHRAITVDDQPGSLHSASACHVWAPSSTKEKFTGSRSWARSSRTT